MLILIFGDKPCLFRIECQQYPCHIPIIFRQRLFMFFNEVVLPVPEDDYSTNMRSECVLFKAPSFNKYLRLFQGIEDLTIRQFIPHDGACSHKLRQKKRLYTNNFQGK
jgi:hypothetical protein